MDDLVELVLEGVGVGAEGTATCCLDLKEKHGNRRLPVFVAAHEGSAIRFALQGRSAARPMTHDALKQTVEVLGGRVVRIVVGHQPETFTFTADVTLTTAEGESHLDWRVSDAVALAVRCDPPPAILAPASLLTEGSPPAG